MMRGTYTVKEAISGKSYDVNIPAFTLDSPHEGLILN
jgi:ApaG protein